MPRRATTALMAAAFGVLLLIFTWYAAFHIGIFRHADQSIFRGFFDLRQRARIDRVAHFVANLCNPQPYVYLAAVPALIALVRRRVPVAFAVGAILLGSNVTTQLLKPLLAQPRPAGLLGGVSAVPPASWPSGHATAAMALALTMVIAVPARRRPVVAALGAAFAVAVSYSFLTLGWHYPSDVFGGFLVAATWTALGVAVLLALRDRQARAPIAAEPARPSVRAALVPPSAAALGAVLLAGLVALARPHEVVSYARAHETFMIGAAAIAMLGLVLATAVMLALRR